MTKFYLSAMGVLALLSAVLFVANIVQSKIYKAKLKKAENAAIEKQNEKTKREEEIINNANKKKSDMRSGDDASSFNASLDVLRKHTSS